MSLIISDNVVAFPLGSHLTRRDIAEVSRWAAESEASGWFLRTASVSTGAGGVRWLDRTPDGHECFSMAYGHPNNTAYYVVIRRGARWHLHDAFGDSRGEFRALRDALDIICPVQPGAA